MKIRQFTEFAVFSADLTADEVTARLGITPDEVLVRGSRRPGPPPVPRAHGWKLVARTPGRVDEQAESLLRRLAPAREQLVELRRQPTVSLGLMVVRYLADEDGDDDGLGWHLGAESLAFLAAVGASVDVDEYDYSGDDA